MKFLAVMVAAGGRLSAALTRLLPEISFGTLEPCPAGAPLLFARRGDPTDDDPAEDNGADLDRSEDSEDDVDCEGEAADEEVDPEAEAELAEIEAELPKTRSEWSGGSGKEDMEIIGRFLAGDDQAFIKLVLRYQNRVHNLCYRLLGDTHEAQDMAQEIFLTVHRSLKNFRGDSLFSTWIFRIATNHCKNRIKYLGRRKYYQSSSLDQPREAEDGDIFSEVEDENPDPESCLGSDEIQKVVQEAIATLDEEHRMVIVLRDIQDQSYEEIAEVLGLKVGTVKSRIHRARNELKRKLEAKLGK